MLLWLVFEAGAIAKSLKKARVVPLCIDLPPSDITGPLVGFQIRSLDEHGIRRLVHDLNKSAERQIPEKALDGLFERMWPDLQAAIAKAVDGAPSTQKSERATDDMLADVVDRTRRIELFLEAQSAQSATAMGETARRSSPYEQLLREYQLDDQLLEAMRIASEVKQLSAGSDDDPGGVTSAAE